MLPTTIPGAWTPSTPQAYRPYFGFGSSNQVYSNSIPVENVVNDDDGESEPSRPYIPDSSNSVGFTTYGATPSANGGTATMNQITLQPADATHPGGVTVGAQSFAGAKTFTGAVTVASLTTAGNVACATLTATGNISALSLDPVNYINIPATTGASVGTIKQAGTPMVHTYGTTSLAVGSGASNFTNTGQGNVFVGALNGAALTSGSFNTAVGYGPLRNALAAVGNCCYGNSAGLAITTGITNCCYGINSGNSIQSGQDNILYGPNTGAGITGADSNVTEVGNGTLKTPVAGDLILGQTLTLKTYIAGIAGITPPGTPEYVIIDPATKQLGSAAIPTAGVTAVGAIGTGPTANGASITGTTLNLQAATSTTGGVLTNIAQSIQGDKTFIDNIIGSKNIVLPTTSSSTVGSLTIGNLLLHNYSANASKTNVFLGPAAGNYTTNSLNNIGIGNTSLAAITTGSANTGLGKSTGASVTTGSSNVFLGYQAGQSTATGCSNAIEISDGTFGTSVSNDVRIGTSVSAQCYIGGIGSVAVGGTPRYCTINTATNQLGSVAIPTPLTYSTTSASYTPTTDAGAITTMTVHGAGSSTLTLKFTLIGNIATVTIPQFTITAFVGGPNTINVNTASFSATYRPVQTFAFSIPFNRSTPEMAGLYVSTGGNITIQRLGGGLFATTCGIYADFSVSYPID